MGIIADYVKCLCQTWGTTYDLNCDWFLAKDTCSITTQGKF